MRLVLERHPSVGKLGTSCVDVVDAEVDDRARMVELRALGDGEHESHVPAHEEGERACLEQDVETDGVTVEGDGLRQVTGVDRDLADARDRGCHSNLLCIADASIRSKCVC